MKWSDEKVQQLHDLAFAGRSNKEIARQLGVSIDEVYAKRSQLGITIDKVKAAQGEVAVSPEIEKLVQDMDDGQAFSAKKELIRLLEPVLKIADKSVKHLSLIREGKTVLIDCGTYGTNVDIEGDSLLAMIADVTRKCLY